MKTVSEKALARCHQHTNGSYGDTKSSANQTNVSIFHHRSQEVLGFLLALPLQGFTALSNAAIMSFSFSVKLSSRSQSCGAANWGSHSIYIYIYI